MGNPGYTAVNCISLDDPQLDDLDGTCDVISCLNVLDRCADPLALLTSMHRKLKPTGVILLAVSFFFLFPPHDLSTVNELVA